MTTLFTLPIPISSPAQSSPAQSSPGTITCASPSPLTYLLTFSSPPDNRLTTSFCQTFLLALDIIEFQHPVGVLITTSAIPKFYSNGLDLEHASTTEGFFPNSMYAVWKRLLTYPMPTIALINGHSFAAGFMTAMYHDYRIFNPSRGFLCLNELDFGAPLKPPMSSIFRQKLPSPHVYRSLVLEAHRFNAKEALEAGLVDVLGGLEEVLNLVEKRKLREKGKTGIYGVLKREMYRETIGYLEGYVESESRDKRNIEGDDERRAKGRKRVQEWATTKAKL